MPKLGDRQRGRKHRALPHADLFAFADDRDRRERWQRAPFAARLLARRFGLPLDRAALTAELAGIGGER